MGRDPAPDPRLRPARARGDRALAELHYALAGADEVLGRTQLVEFTTRDIDSVKALARRRADDRRPPRPLPVPLPDPPPLPQSYVDRFAEVFSPRLDLDRQLELFARLRFDIEAESNVTEATELLARLYDRPDVSWRVRQDIEALRARDDRPPEQPSAAELGTRSEPDRGSRLVASSAHERAVGLRTAHGEVLLRYELRGGDEPGDVVLGHGRRGTAVLRMSRPVSAGPRAGPGPSTIRGTAR